MNHNGKHISWVVPVLPALTLALAAFAPAAFAAATAPPTYAYALTILGPLGGSNSFGTGVNSSGQVTGYADTTSGGQDAFLSGPNGVGLTDLGTLPGGSFSQGFGVNDGGQVAGYADDSFGQFHPFLSGPNGAGLTDLGTLPGGGFSPGLETKAAVNASGQVAGEALTAGGDGRAFLSGPNGAGPLKNLGTLGGNLSIGYGVNAGGQVTGESTTASGIFRAFLSGPNGAGLTDLGTLPGGGSSIGSGVNASGQVAGYAYAPSGSTHAFLSGPNGTGLTDLGTLSGTYSQGDGVNDSGQVVGASDGHAFLYSGGVMTDLNTLIPPATGNQAPFILEEATSISNNGFIAGVGTYSGSFHYAFLLTPIPVNSGPKITVTATASPADTNGRRTITVTTTNTGGAAADLLQITRVTLGGIPPASGSPSLLPTTPNNLSNLPRQNTQANGFYFSPSPGTTQAVLNIVGNYTDPNRGITGAFTSTIRLRLP